MGEEIMRPGSHNGFFISISKVVLINKWNKFSPTISMNLHILDLKDLPWLDPLGVSVNPPPGGQKCIDTNSPPCGLMGNNCSGGIECNLSTSNHSHLAGQRYLKKVWSVCFVKTEFRIRFGTNWYVPTAAFPKLKGSHCPTNDAND